MNMFIFKELKKQLFSNPSCPAKRPCEGVKFSRTGLIDDFGFWILDF